MIPDSLVVVPVHTFSCLFTAGTGALQMLFLLYTCQASTPLDFIHRMSLPQFKAMLQAAKVTSSSLPPEKLDDVFTAVQASPGALQR